LKVLLLGSFDSSVNRILRDAGEDVVVTSKPITRQYLDHEKPEFLVSHGYGYILPEEILAYFEERAINLHPSLLPWNRGSDPDLWSLLDDTPKGVTIHHMTSGIDAGDILVQTEVELHELDTLRSYYARLRDHLTEMFERHWPAIKTGRIQRIPQGEGGTYHRAVDKEALPHDLVYDWDRPVADILGKAKLL
jgi:methionyl-tRNA formyltransferase